ncbi:hypothetical protein PTKIN_Ptkin06aG0015400 [Pterospermum kingtungense]
MEGRKGVGSSSSSSFTELFGSKDSPSSSTGIFGSIFAPPSKVFGRESLRPDMMAKRQDSPNDPWNTKPGASGNASKGHEGENENIANRDVISSIYQEQRVMQPCHLSSSIYYGGQDVFYYPQSSQGSGISSVYNKDATDDDSGIASRGNWWKGSLYY